MHLRRMQRGLLYKKMICSHRGANINYVLSELFSETIIAELPPLKVYIVHIKKKQKHLSQALRKYVFETYASINPFMASILFHLNSLDRSTSI